MSPSCHIFTVFLTYFRFMLSFRCSNYRLFSSREFPMSPTLVLGILLFVTGYFVQSVDGGTIIQSKLCTAQELEQRIQCFREKPQDRYEVPKGGVVVINCVVANLKGKMQWRAQSMLLGYDRTIPGWPRFRIRGSERAGESNLEITNLTQLDQGEYECQVTPAGKHPLLRKKTNLIVLVKPSPPHILYRNAAPPQGRIVLSRPDQVARVELACISEGGSPHPTFQWLHNGLPLRPSRQVIIDQLGPIRSRLSVVKNLLKDGDQVTCIVSNKATQLDSDPEKRKLRAVVNIAVHSPPGSPQIMDFQEDRIYSEGDRLTASCVANPAGKPAGSLIWRWQLSGPDGNKTEEVPARFYTRQNAGYRLVNRLLVPTLRRKYHGAKLVCEATHEIGPVQSTSVNVKVKYPPANVSIMSEDGSTKWMERNGKRELVVYGRAGETRRLVCLTAPYFDRAIVKWISVGGTGAERREIQSRNRVMRTTDRASYHQESVISVIIRREDSGRWLECEAWGEAETKVYTRVRLDIVYPPDKPVITGYQTDNPVKEGHLLELICVSHGGNPLPDLTWYKNDAYIESELMVTAGMQRTRKLRITLRKEDNGAQFYCNATSPASTRGVASTPVRLNVLFPPTRVQLHVPGPTWVSEGRSVVIQCEADSSNPGAVLRWRHYACGKDDTAGKLGESKCRVNYLTGTDEPSIPGDYGGTRTTSRVEMQPSWRDNHDLVECRAEHSALVGLPESKSVHARIQLNVTFQPQFQGLTQGGHRVVEEGSSKELDMSPVANPAVVRYSWLRGDHRLTSSGGRITSSRGRLILNGVRVEDMGNYTLIASNDQGESRFTFFLNVTYGPRLKGRPHLNYTVVNENAELECHADANPAVSDKSFLWQRMIPPGGPNDVSNLPLIEGGSIRCNQGEWSGNFKYFAKCRGESLQEMSSSLMIYGVTPEDVGQYRCTVANGVGREVTRTINLILPFKPRLIPVNRFLKAAGQIGGRVLLFCFSQAEPSPDFQWFRGPNNLTLVHGDKFRLSSQPVRVGLYRGQLEVVNLQRSDYGQYYCQASNSKGKSVQGIRVSPTGPPEPPYLLRLLNSTADSLRIAWKQGFDGGLEQTFQIRWKVASSRSGYKYTYIKSDNSREEVEATLQGLKSNTQYLLSVNSRNGLPAKSGFSSFLRVSTKFTPGGAAAHRPAEETSASAEDSPNDDNALLIIVAACVFGFVVLVINILVITFFVKRRGGLCRRRPKPTNSAGYVKADTVEMFPRVNGCARGLPDDQKTYSSYDTASEDLKEDLLKKHTELGLGLGHLGLASPPAMVSPGGTPYWDLLASSMLGGVRGHPQAPSSDGTASPPGTASTSLHNMPLFHHRSGGSSPLHHHHTSLFASPPPSLVAQPGTVSGHTSPTPVQLLNQLAPICETTDAGYHVNSSGGYGGVQHPPHLTTFLPMQTHHPTPPHTPQRCSPLMTNSFQRHMIHSLSPAELDHHNLLLQNSYSDHPLYHHDPNRGPYLNSFNPENHQRHSYAEELRRVQFSGPVTQVPYPGNSLPRYTGLPQNHPYQHLYPAYTTHGMAPPHPQRTTGGSLSPVDLVLNPQHFPHPGMIAPVSSHMSPPIMHSPRSMSRASMDMIIPPPKDFSPPSSYQGDNSIQAESSTTGTSAVVSPQGYVV